MASGAPFSARTSSARCKNCPKVLTKAIGAALRLELYRFELTLEMQRDERVADAKEVRQGTGLYKAVRDTSDQLFEEHDVTHHNWACLRDEDVAAIAKILKRRI